MSTVPSEKIERLPKWARDYIRTLEARRDEALRARDQARGEDPRPGIAFRDDLDDERRTAVAWGRYDEIRFYLYGRERDHDWIAFRRRVEGEIEVTSGHSLYIEPIVSNSVRLRVD